VTQGSGARRLTSQVEVAVEPVGIASRTGVSIATAVATSDPAALEALFAALEAALADNGLSPADIVRNRLIAATRPMRNTASALRFARWTGAARSATSSYIDPNRFAGGDGVHLDTLALRGTAATKLVIENDPPPPPARLIATGDLVFLSGLTSTEPELFVQVQRIRGRLAESLARAADLLGRPVRPTAATVYVDRSVGLDELADLAEMVGIVGVPLAVARCDGFSTPGKLLELEIDAAATG
jgi:hypothetical protein